MKTSIILSLFVFLSLGAFSQSAIEISQKSTDAIDIGDMEMASTIYIRDARSNVRERKIVTASKTFGDVSKMLIRFIAPADVKGTALLVYDYTDKADNMWIYMPALRKVRRIVSTEKGKSFMGSEFTNADMSKPNMADFTYKTLGSEKIDSKDCWKVESTCKTAAIAAENGFSYRISFIDKSNYLCYRVEYYNSKDALQRVQTISNYKKQTNGKYFAHQMLMLNKVNKRESEMIIDKFQVGSKMTEADFSPTALE